jgi:hypothetical protein
VDNINDEQLLEDYMGGLKEDIKHDIFSRHPTMHYGIYAIYLSYSIQE